MKKALLAIIGSILLSCNIQPPNFHVNKKAAHSGKYKDINLDIFDGPQPKVCEPLSYGELPAALILFLKGCYDKPKDRIVSTYLIAAFRKDDFDLAARDVAGSLAEFGEETGSTWVIGDPLEAHSWCKPSGPGMKHCFYVFKLKLKAKQRL